MTGPRTPTRPSGPAAALTVAAAQRLARQARRYGYYTNRDDPRVVSVTCPRCTDPVSATRQPRRASRGPLYEPVARTLDQAMVAHLTGGWCQP